VTLLRLGNILDAGFHQIFVTYSVPVYAVGDIIDTWVYRQGVLDFQFSLATAVGLFKGVIGLGLVLFFNRIAKRYTDTSLF
jgi:putative aldouronate transport system permease protein